MSTIKHPVGPQPSKVYWRRRLLVILGALAVIVVIILIVTRPGSGTPADDTKSGATGESADPSPETTTDAAADPLACDPADISLEAVTDKVSYNAGELPQISLTLTNTSDVDCIIQAGSDVQEFRILSGEEQYWSSKDCQTDAVPAPVTLKPGVPVSTTPILWNRTRSSVETCEATDLPLVPAEGASYHLTTFVGDIESANSKQFLLY